MTLFATKTIKVFNDQKMVGYSDLWCSNDKITIIKQFQNFTKRMLTHRECFLNKRNAY